jgi:hypothetical protein
MYIKLLLLIIYVDSSMFHLLCWCSHTQLALTRVIKREEKSVLFHSIGLLHSAKLTVDLDTAGTI